MVRVRAIGVVGVLGVIVWGSSVDVGWRHVVTVTSESAQVRDIDVALSSVLHEVYDA